MLTRWAFDSDFAPGTLVLHAWLAVGDMSPCRPRQSPSRSPHLSFWDRADAYSAGGMYFYLLFLRLPCEWLFLCALPVRRLSHLAHLLPSCPLNTLGCRCFRARPRACRKRVLQRQGRKLGSGERISSTATLCWQGERAKRER